MNFSYQNRDFKFNRYPKTDNRSLRAWNAGDEHLLQYLEELSLKEKSIAIYNDRFGMVSGILQEYSPYSIVQFQSQRKAFAFNFKKNDINCDDQLFLSPLDDFPKSIDIACIKIPKSTDLFDLFLAQLTPFLAADGQVICSFMTKHFNASLLAIANNYFEEVDQSKAWKKSRLLVLKKKKKDIPTKSVIKTLKLDENQGIQQYFGVFSGNRIDYATQFLLEHLTLKSNEHKVLDLAAGNGVIAYHLRQQSDDCEIHVLDDDTLAMASARLNLTDTNTIFHLEDTMDNFEADSFDLIACNPPFHFEHENTIEIALQLFKGAARCLKNGGRFVLVSNIHLNYMTHLEKLFPQVAIRGENAKFIVCECW